MVAHITSAITSSYGHCPPATLTPVPSHQSPSCPEVLPSPCKSAGRVDTATCLCFGGPITQVALNVQRTQLQGGGTFLQNNGGALRPTSYPRSFCEPGSHGPSSLGSFYFLGSLAGSHES